MQESWQDLDSGRENKEPMHVLDYTPLEAKIQTSSIHQQLILFYKVTTYNIYINDGIDQYTWILLNIHEGAS